MNRATLTIAAFALALFVGFVCGKGYEKGQNAQAALAAAEASRKLDLARQVLQTERDNLARENEDLAREDPPSTLNCLGPNRVRRLNALR